MFLFYLVKIYFESIVRGSKMEEKRRLELGVQLRSGSVLSRIGDSGKEKMGRTVLICR